MRKQLMTLIGIALIGLLAACSQQTDTGQADKQASTNVEKKVDQAISTARSADIAGKRVKAFNLTAQQVDWTLSPEKQIKAWTFNGSVPGEQLRVKEGEVVKATLTNKLDEPVTIHWHGVPVPNTQDGIPGVTQDAVLPGETYTYEFVADDPGTYWYHTHQNGVEQLDRGLYGTLIVEPKEGILADRDYTLVLDEWESGAGRDNGDKGMGNMGDGGMKNGMHEGNVKENMSSMNNMMMHDMSSYDIFTVNGKTYEENEPLMVKKGETVKLRFVNAGYMVHQMHIPVDFRVTHVDGQIVNRPGIEKSGIIEIAPGERYDIEFTADTEKDFMIDNHDGMPASKDMQIDVAYENGNGKKMKHPSSSDVVDVTKLGKSKESFFSLDDSFDVAYTMDLGVAMDHQNMGMVYTINGKTFPDVPPVNVNEGDKVKVTLKNNSMDNSTHPMHLHGHFFQVLSKDGKPLKDSPIIKDTLNVKPGEEYEVAFLADNPGNWLFHCHDLHHASTGMVAMVEYNHFAPFYKDTGKVENIPE